MAKLQVLIYSLQNWMIEHRGLRMYPVNPALGTDSRLTTAKWNRPWGCILSWQQMDIHVCCQSEVWLRSLSKAKNLPSCQQALLLFYLDRTKGSSFHPDTRAILELLWNYTNVTELRVWDCGNKEIELSKCDQKEEGICYDVGLWGVLIWQRDEGEEISESSE